MGMLVFPFLVIAFWIQSLLELCYSLWRKVITPGWDMKSTMHKEKQGELQMQVFDPDDPELDWRMLQTEYIDRGVPFVLRRKDGKPLSGIAPPAYATEAAFEQGNIRVVKTPYFVSLPGLDECVKRYVFLTLS